MHSNFIAEDTKIFSRAETFFIRIAANNIPVCISEILIFLIYIFYFKYHHFYFFIKYIHNQYKNIYYSLYKKYASV